MPAESKDTKRTDLREMIVRGQVVVVIGSGVSIATNRRSPKWRELIETALKSCLTIGAPQDWCDVVEQSLKTSHASTLLSAAELVHEKLSDNGGGEFARWLRKSFEPLEPEFPAVIQALAALRLPLVTTNYDGLIEKVTRLRPVSWMDGRIVSRVVRGDDRRVLHLHGYWDQPESVVLGIRSYEAVKNNKHTRAVMQALGMTRSFLFVGCGEEGLADPNWEGFLSWLEAVETGAGVEHRHYRLVREEDDFEPRGRLFPLVYGRGYDDLLPFLQRLRPERNGEVEEDTSVPEPGSGSLPDSVNDYLRRLEDDTAFLTLLGMGRNLQVELPIAEAYVPLRTTMVRSMDERQTERFKPGYAEHEEEVDLGQVFRKAAELDQHGVILLGEPGSGKTTGARQLAWRLASRESLPKDLGLPAGMTPVFLRFRNLGKAVLLGKNGLRQFLDDETHCEEAPDGLQSPGADLWNGSGGGLLWILDGLDEVVDPATRKKVSGWIQSAIRKRLDDRFLVTCRFAGYFREGVPLGPRFVEFHVRPLDDEQVEAFVRAWFAAAYGKLLGPGPRAAARTEEDSDALLVILARPSNVTGHIRELCTNPLLLTILCIVFHEERKLPTGRAELYAHCIRVLLEYWRRDLYDESDRGTVLQAYDAEAAQAVLARLAWWLHQEQDRISAPLAELGDQAALGLAQVSPSSGLGRDGLAFLERMRDEAGILAMEGDGRCGFLHLSFQEYLAAEHAAREGFAQELASVASDSWWREAALLSLRRSRPFCEAFFREMIEVGIAENHPDLAERCLSEALYFVPGPFVAALNRPRPKAAKARAAHDARVAAILRLLRDRAEQVPELEDISRGLAGSKDQETRGFAREILARRGVESEAEAGWEGTFVDQKTGITLMPIPAGEFQMGSAKIDAEEKPIHRVRISKDFWIGKYPVTNAQYGRYMKVAGKRVKKPAHWDDRRFNQSEQPVVGVSWDEARAFCEWVGGRLPTEAEWEFACRAGTTTEFSFGDDESELGDHGWFTENSDGQTQPVGAKKPNDSGLHDMHGNVWEWCQDRWGAKYYLRSPDSDSSGPKRGSRRVIRGGSWGIGARHCSSACRSRSDPAGRSNDLSFRLARSSVESGKGESVGRGGS